MRITNLYSTILGYNFVMKFWTNFWSSMGVWTNKPILFWR